MLQRGKSGANAGTQFPLVLLGFNLQRAHVQTPQRQTGTSQEPGGLLLARGAGGTAS